jgi:dTDP-4-amino-4,6-dideoxygalactose transaminase
MINLPLYSHMTTDDIDTIARAVERIHANAPAVRAALR